MNDARPGLRARLTIGAALASTSATAAIGLILRFRLAASLDPALPPAEAARVLSDWTGTFALAGAAAVLGLTALAFMAATRVTRALERLRGYVDALGRGAADPARAPWPIEYGAVAQAAARLAAEADARSRSLESERSRLEQLVDSVSEGILELTPAGRLAHANPAARSALGLRDDAMGRPLSTVIRNAELRQAFERATAGPDRSVVELALDERRYLATATPLGGGGAVIAFMDITELRRLENVRRDFVANVSHELKTPLTSIRGYAETLLTDELPIDAQRQFLEVIQKNAVRLQRIADELLDLSRLESGGWRPEPKRVDVLEAAAEVWQASAERAAERGITFETDGAREIVTADPAALNQIFANLFENAVRHTGAGGRIGVRIRTSPGSLVDIEVRDTGSGISRDALPRIFERFYRVDPARSRAEGGTGLGLAIVKHLVERMGGSVAAESELGKGTTIRFSLPRA